jgi:uncharacterized repeat protein (TIGR03803 family)
MALAGNLFPPQPAFAASAPDDSFEMLFDFSWDTGSNTPGGSPSGGLSLGHDGDLYGTAIYAGPGGSGSVFRWRLDGRLRATSHYGGAAPNASPTEGLDGALYGTDMAGGTYGKGSVFRIARGSHAYTVLHSFSGVGADGWYAQSALMRAADGSFFGTTTHGGENDAGTVFRIGTDGSLTTLHSFDYDTCGLPWTNLVLASDGMLYGTCEGNFDAGSVYRISQDGDFRVLHSFGHLEGSRPTGLMQARDGFFYGSNYSGGKTGGGVVYRMAADGGVTVLHDFACSLDGCGARPLMQASDGHFYGTTSGGGPGDGRGTVFHMTPAGKVAVLHTFHGADGSFPTNSLIEAGDGRLYGTTAYGGAEDIGVLFSLAKLRH